MARFEVVSQYQNANIQLPTRATSDSAGYDLAAASTIIVPSLYKQLHDWNYNPTAIEKFSDMPDLTKRKDLRPTLVPTGLKCYLDEGTYLAIMARSSTPYKHGLIIANGVGLIDADYVDNESNEGHIFVQLLNFTPVDIIIETGDKIAQAVIQHYDVVDEDAATGTRIGGFGSTTV